MNANVWLFKIGSFVTSASTYYIFPFMGKSRETTLTQMQRDKWILVAMCEFSGNNWKIHD